MKLEFYKAFYTFFFFFCCSAEVISQSLCCRRSKTRPILNGTSLLYFSLVNFALRFLDLRNRELSPSGPEFSLQGRDDGQKKIRVETASLAIFPNENLQGVPVFLFLWQDHPVHWANFSVRFPHVVKPSKECSLSPY